MHQMGEGKRRKSGDMQQRAGRARRAVCADGPAGGSRAVCHDGPSGDMHRQARQSGGVQRRTGVSNRAVCSVETARQSGGMHRRAGWGSRAECTDGPAGACGMHRRAGGDCRAECIDGRVGRSGGMYQRPARAVRWYAPDIPPGGMHLTVCTNGRRGAVGPCATTGRWGRSALERRAVLVAVLDR